MTDRPIVVLDEEWLERGLPDLSRYTVARLYRDPDADLLAQARVLIAGGDGIVDAVVMDRMPALGLIAAFPAGYEAIDVAEARRRGIAVGRAIDANHEDVADLAIALILAHRRGIVASDRAVRDGTWAQQRTILRSIGGQRLGIVGLGAIGRAVARRAEALRMTVAWWGPNPKPDAGWPRAADVAALAADSDIVLVAAPATDETAGLVSATVIDALGPDGLLVNVSRGALVDEDALIAALRDGRLGGAALDVFATEPTPPERWRGVPNTLLTTHIAGATDAAVAEMGRQCLANVDAFLAGEPLPTPVA